MIIIKLLTTKICIVLMRPSMKVSYYRISWNWSLISLLTAFVPMVGMNGLSVNIPIVYHNFISNHLTSKHFQSFLLLQIHHQMNQVKMNMNIEGKLMLNKMTMHPLPNKNNNSILQFSISLSFVLIRISSCFQKNITIYYQFVSHNWYSAYVAVQ